MVLQLRPCVELELAMTNQDNTRYHLLVQHGVQSKYLY